MIEIPRTLLKQILKFAAIYGPTTEKRQPHAIVQCITLHVKNGKLFIGTKNSSSTAMAFAFIANEFIKGEVDLRFTDITRIVGGKDFISDTTWTSIIDDLDDPVQIEIVGNRIFFNRKGNLTVDVPLAEENVSEMFNIPLHTIGNYFTWTEATQDNDSVLLDGNGEPMKHPIAFLGSTLKSLVKVEKKTTDVFEFSLEQGSLSTTMKMGNESRRITQKIGLLEPFTGKSFKALAFIGIEAFSNMIVDDKRINIFYEDQKFTFFQGISNWTIILKTGEKIT